MNCLRLIPLLLAELITRGSSVVQTNIGPIQGKMMESGKVEAFLGIPYAEPPIGPLRFSKPVPKTSWQDVYEATRLPPACIQIKMKGLFFVPDADYMSEDCLYLNFWVPNSKSTDGPKTIMLFIHGGGFKFGSSNIPLYDGAKLAEHGDVIVATMNYRLGGLGFLTDFTDGAPGSVGLYDQVMAMEWVKENAKHFNGDPESIVLFGESAGAFSVSFHQISPLSKHLFKRAILQSGSSVSPIYDDNNVELKKVIKEYAGLVGCIYDDFQSCPNDVIDCLRNIPAEKFSEIDMEVFLIRYKFPSPRVGNDFLPESTIDAFRKGNFKDSEVLMGVNIDEGTLLLSVQKSDLFDLFGEKDVASMFNETTAYYFLKTTIKYIDWAAVDKIIRGYIDDVSVKPNYTYLKAASEAIGDYLMICGNVFQAEYQSLKGNSVFFYVFDHRPASSPYAEWLGVAHGDELQFVFGNPMHKHFTEYEVELSRNIMDMWVSFAKTGNPKLPGPITWPRFTHKNPMYFVIGQRNTIGINPDHFRCEKWRNLYRSVIDEDVIRSPEAEELKSASCN